MTTFSAKIKHLLSLRLLIATLTLSIVIPNKVFSMDLNTASRQQARIIKSMEIEFTKNIDVNEKIKNIINIFTNHQRHPQIDTLDRYFLKEGLNKLINLIRQSNPLKEEILKSINQLINYLETKNKLNEANQLRNMLPQQNTLPQKEVTQFKYLPEPEERQNEESEEEQTISPEIEKLIDEIDIHSNETNPSLEDPEEDPETENILVKILTIMQNEEAKSLNVEQLDVEEVDDTEQEHHKEKLRLQQLQEIRNMAEEDKQEIQALKQTEISDIIINILQNPFATTKKFWLFNKPVVQDQINTVKKELNNSETFTQTINILATEISKTNIARENILEALKYLLVTIEKSFNRFISKASYFDLAYFERLYAVINLTDILIAISNKLPDEDDIESQGELRTSKGQIQILQNLINEELYKLPRRIQILSKNYFPTNFVSRFLGKINIGIETLFSYVGIKKEELNPLDVQKPLSNFILSLSRFVNYKIENELIQKIAETAMQYYYEPMRILIDTQSIKLDDFNEEFIEEFISNFDKIIRRIQILETELLDED